MPVETGKDNATVLTKYNDTQHNDKASNLSIRTLVASVIMLNVVFLLLS
jgi:hypothetical protein